jgi:hypothetical protein
MKYKVGGSVHASTFIGEFEADSPEAAFEQAYKAAYVSVCHQCADAIQDPEVAHLWAEDENRECTREPTAEDELAKLKSAIVFDVRDTYTRRSIGMSDEAVFAKWLDGVKERGWTPGGK